MEGGYYRQTYRSAGLVPGSHKPYGGAIYYLLTDHPDSFSALHRLTTDEFYHFYLGDPVELLLLHPDGHSEHVTLGQDILSGQRVQFVAPAGAWQGSRVAPGGRFTLLGTTLAPAWTPEDYTGGVRAELVTTYPAEAELIRLLTRD